MRLRDLLPRTGDRQARQAWEDLVSREMLGSVIIGTGMGKVVESLILILFPASPFGQLIGWIAAVVVGVRVFVYWHRVSAAAAEKAEQAGEAAQEAKETVEDVAETAKETVEDATGGE